MTPRATISAAHRSTFEIFEDGRADENVVSSAKGVPSITDDPSGPEEVIRRKKAAPMFEIFEDVSEPINTFDNESLGLRVASC